MELPLQISALGIDTVYIQIAKYCGWFVGIVTGITWTVSKMIKLAEGVTKIKEYFEADQQFRENTTEILDDLVKGQAIGREISKMVISKTGSFFSYQRTRGYNRSR